MVRSRLRRYQEKKEKRQIVFSLVGIFALLVFLLLFGVRILVAFSLFVDKIRGTTPKTEQQQDVLVLPPELDYIPEATNSGKISVSGKVRDPMTIILYVNDQKDEEIEAKDDGSFVFKNVTLTTGTNSISTKAKDDKGNTSGLSQVLTIICKKDNPKLEISTPSDNAEITGDDPTLTISGITDPENTLTINDRLVVVSNDGSFTYELNLSEGEQTLTYIAVDIAGNQTKVEQKVKYKK